MKPQNSKTRKTPKCAYCGKTLINGTCGKLCATRIDKGETPETRKIALLRVSLPNPPAGWLKIAAIGRLCQTANIPISRIVRAFGGDTPQGTYNATPAIMGLVYIGKTRYCNPFWGSKTGLQVIANGGGKIPPSATPQYAHGLCNGSITPAKVAKTPQPAKVAQPVTPQHPYATITPAMATYNAMVENLDNPLIAKLATMQPPETPATPK